MHDAGCKKQDEIAAPRFTTLAMISVKPKASGSYTRLEPLLARNRFFHDEKKQKSHT